MRSVTRGLGAGLLVHLALLGVPRRFPQQSLLELPFSCSETVSWPRPAPAGPGSAAPASSFRRGLGAAAVGREDASSSCLGHWTLSALDSE